MMLRLICPACVAEAYKREQTNGTRSLDVPVPVSRVEDSGVYKIRCPAGHAANIFVMNIRCELLFEMGLNAVVDGYPREAVTSFAAALERFYEFYWRVAATDRGVPTEEIAKSWKALSKQSERQLGGFVTASLYLNQIAPTLLAQKQIELRNRVVHTGYVPTTAEAVAFGDEVLALMRDALQVLRTHASSAVDAVHESMIAPAHAEATSDPDAQSAGCNVLCAFDIMHPPSDGDSRLGGVADQFVRVQQDRQPFGLVMLAPEETESSAALG